MSEGKKFLDNSLRRLGRNIAQEIEDVSQKVQKITLVRGDIEQILEMTEEKVNDFFQQKEIDFRDPIVITYPGGTFENTQWSAAKIKESFKRYTH